MLVSVSLTAFDLSTAQSTQQAVELVERSGADALHIDVQDGLAASQVSVWNDPERIKALRTSLPLDVHLMIKDVDERAGQFVLPGVSMITFQIEDSNDPARLLSRLHRQGIKAGIALHPSTPVERIEPFLDLADAVLVLCVNPGPSGQLFLPESVQKVALMKEKFPSVLVMVDGGMTPEHAALALGADIIVAGAFVALASDTKAAIDSLRSQS